MSAQREKGTLWISLTAPLVLFTGVFHSRVFSTRYFWLAMPAAVCALVILACALDRGIVLRLLEDFRVRPLRKIGAGLVAAAGLYLVFAIGRLVVTRWIPGSLADLAAIYALRSERSPWMLAGLLVFIGTGEELFWRHHLQFQLQRRSGPLVALTIQALLYASVHAASANVTLVLAALVAGWFWGMTYVLWHSASLNIVSHVAWDVAIFLIVPLN